MKGQGAGMEGTNKGGRGDCGRERLEGQLKLRATEGEYGNLIQ